MNDTNKTPALLTVDLEDYRRQQLRDDLKTNAQSYPHEVNKQLEMILQLFKKCSAQATFFTVGRLAPELSADLWKELIAYHKVGCHSHEHFHVKKLGHKEFSKDIKQAKDTLEHVSGQQVISYRAPYFSADGCDPWFGETLAQNGFKIDSSRRFSQLSSENEFVPGSNQMVREIPLMSIGFGLKRLTVIGGTYFRLLPYNVILKLLKKAQQKNFLPVIYLHPYDVDPSRELLDLPQKGFYKAKMADRMRKMGSSSVASKLMKLSQHFDFKSMESVL